LSESDKEFAVAQSIAMAKRGCVLLLRNESLFSTLIENWLFGPGRAEVHRIRSARKYVLSSGVQGIHTSLSEVLLL